MESTSTEFEPALNYSTQPAVKRENDTETVLQFILLVVNSVSDVIGLFVNVTLIVAILTRKKVRQSQRVVQLLIVNLAVLSILENTVKYFNTGKEVHLINVPGPLCSLVSFLRSVIHTSFLVNIVVVIYERLRSFREGNNRKLIRTTQLVAFIWISSTIFSVPTALMKAGKEEHLQEIIDDEAKTDLHLGKCKSVHLFGLLEATLVYETIRFLLLHVGVGIYMLYAVMEIRSRLKYLMSHSNIPRQRLKRKMDSIRLIYFYLLSFVIVALPFGIIIFYRRVALRITSGSNIITEFLQAFDVVLLPALFFYFYMSPLLSYLFLEGFSFPYVFCFCKNGHQIRSDTSEQREASLIATCAPSSDVVEPERDILLTNRRSIQGIENETETEDGELKRNSIEVVEKVEKTSNETLV